MNNMRALILKQQAALKEMSQQNCHYRKKIGEYQNMLIQMRQEQLEKQERIDHLTLEKEGIDAEVQWLREEVRLLRKEDDESLSSEADLRRKLHNLMRLEAESPSTRSGASDVLVDPFSFNKYLDQKTDKKAPMPLTTDSKKLPPKSPRNTTGGFETPKTPSEASFEGSNAKKNALGDFGFDFRDDSDSIVEQRASVMSESREGILPKVQENDGRLKGVSSASNGAHHRRTPSIESVKAKESYDSARSSRSEQSREEVDLFKKRLESIQQRRTQRQSERKLTNKTVVRFDTLTM
jgi:hypothetical protein